jgi:diphthamide synthase (EF-2-diphthine--ammonia ligase)
VASLLGKSLTRELHASVLQPVAKDLGLDECGEYGEWHTWVLDGPTYTQRVQVQWEVEVDSQGGHAYLVPQSIQLVDK